MKPKTKLHREITELSQRELPPIYPDQMQWGYDHCLDKLFHKSRGKFYCLECGHSWKADNKRKVQVCPECRTRLKMETEYRSYRLDAAYFAVVTVCKGYQVVQMVWISKRLKMNSEARYFGQEVMQHWIDASGNHTTMSLAVNGLSSACDQWIFGSEMKVKESRGYYSSTHYRHNLSPYKTFPKVRILPVYRRNGFKGNFHGISPLVFFKELLNDQCFETLLKSRQYSLLGLCKDGGIHRYWPSIKICIRNKYIIKDATMWRDYIDLLRYFDKDLRSAHYVCPKNLKKEHDIYMKRKREKMRIEDMKRDYVSMLKDFGEFDKDTFAFPKNLQREYRALIARHKAYKIEIKKKELKEADIKYRQFIQPFLDVAIQKKNIEIVFLKSIKDFKTEGDVLKHCVYTNEYYKNPNSLILSARIDNAPIETIEVSLKSFEVVQARGLQNKSSEYHDQIVSLVNDNMNKIKKIAKSKKKEHEHV